MLPSPSYVRFACQSSYISLTLFPDLQWKHDLFETCMGPVLETVVSAKPVEYAHILTLDIKLRDFYVPPELNMFSQEGLSDVRPMIVQQLYASTGREIGS